MTDVFLSYAREDAPTARQVVDCLEDEGWSVFWDRVIPVGKTWEDVIEDKLSRAACVVVLWSSGSVKSDWVRAETAAAVDRDVLVPVLIDTVSPPTRFRMIQSADLMNWHGRREHSGLLDLLSAVRTLVNPNGKPVTPLPVLTPDDVRCAPENTIAIVEIETGENRGRSWFLTEGMTSVTIGRSRDCDFVVEDHYISRSHCRLEILPTHPGSDDRRQYRFVLFDSGSVTGTTVNGEPVDRVELMDGDHFQTGSVRFRFGTLGEGAA